MATYTDLGNRVKENVVVDYHTRETAQCVKLLNDNNEYHGTFRGVSEISAVNVHGGELSGVVLRDVKFAGSVNLPGHVDLVEVGGEVAELKAQISEIAVSAEKAVDAAAAAKAYTNEAITAATADESQARSDADDKISLSVKLLQQSRELDVKRLDARIDDAVTGAVSMSDLRDLSSTLNAKTVEVSASAKINADSIASSKKRLDASETEIAKIQSKLDTAVENAVGLSAGVNVLSGRSSEISAAVAALTSDIASEATVRETADKKLSVEIQSALDLSVAQLESSIAKARSEAAAKDAFKAPLAEAKEEIFSAMALSVSELEKVDTAAAAVATELSGQLANAAAAIEEEAVRAEAAEEALNRRAAEIEAASAETSKRLDAETIRAEAADAELSEAAGKLQTAVQQLGTELAAEKSARIEADEAASSKMAAHEERAETQLRDVASELEKTIADVSDAAADGIAKAIAHVDEAVWNGCHYKLSNDGKNQWPYRCDDFAVNVYRDAGPDAVVYYNQDGGRAIAVGTLSPEEDGGAVFATFAEIRDENVASSVKPGQTYRFKSASGLKVSTELGCELAYVESESKIEATPVAPAYYAVRCNGMQIGRVYEATVGADGIVDGKLTIATSDPSLRIFNCQNQDFSLADGKTEIAIGSSEKIVYLGNSQFELRSGVEDRRKLDLVDAETGRVFGCVLSSAASDPVKCSESGELESIAIRLDGQRCDVVLARGSGFCAKLSSWTDVDGVGHVRTLRAEAIGSESIAVQMADETVLRAMPVESLDGASQISGYLVPEAWNIDNPLAIDYGTVNRISAYVSAFVPVESVQRDCYVLEKKQIQNCSCGCGVVETAFACSLAENGDSVEMKFTGRAFHIAVTTAAGKTLSYSCEIKSRSEWPIANADSCQTIEARTEALPLPLEFGASYEDPETTWTAGVASEELYDERKPFEMRVASGQERKILLQLPSRTDGRAREFVVAVNPSGKAGEKLPVEFVDSDGHSFDSSVGVVFTRTFGSTESDAFEAEVGKWTVFKVQEMEDFHFVVVDSLDAAGKISVKFAEIAACLETASAGIAANAAAISAESSRAEAAEMSTSLALAAETARAEKAETDLTERAAAAESGIAELSSSVAELSESYGKTSTDHESRLNAVESKADTAFTETTLTAGEDAATLLLKLVDSCDTSKRYALLAEDGTLVLSAIK